MPLDRTANYAVKRWLALVGLSFVFYGALLLIPFAALSAGDKLLLSSALLVCGEASFWIAVFVAGREALSRYRSLDLKTWWDRGKRLWKT
jgi:hypothetical protein